VYFRGAVDTSLKQPFESVDGSVRKYRVQREKIRHSPYLRLKEQSGELARERVYLLGSKSVPSVKDRCGGKPCLGDESPYLNSSASRSGST